MTIKRICECVAGYCNDFGCDFCDLKSCYYDFFGIKINDLHIILIFGFIISILIFIYILLQIKK